MTDVDVQYLAIMNDIIENGVEKYTRAGWVKSIFAKQIRVNLKKGLPLLTTKKVFYKGAIHELLWFLRGDTNIKYLVENGVHIWDDDAFRWYKEWLTEHVVKPYKERTTVLLNESEVGYSCLIDMDKEAFLKNVMDETVISVRHNQKGKWQKYRFGDLGDVYGKQWRNYGVSGRDQIADIIEKLKTSPNDRRMLCIAFNPDVLGKIALPPCHVMFQFYTRELTIYERIALFNNMEEGAIGNVSQYEEAMHEFLDGVGIPKYGLSCMWTQRSVDCPLGLPINLVSYSLLTHIIAKLTNMVPDELIGSLGDCHIYLNQMDGVNEQMHRIGKNTSARLVIHGNQNSVDDFTYDDFEVLDYESDPTIRFPLSVG